MLDLTTRDVLWVWKRTTQSPLHQSCAAVPDQLPITLPISSPHTVSSSGQSSLPNLSKKDEAGGWWARASRHPPWGKLPVISGAKQEASTSRQSEREQPSKNRTWQEEKAEREIRPKHQQRNVPTGQPSQVPRPTAVLWLPRTQFKRT